MRVCVCERETAINAGPLNLNFLRYRMEGVLKEGGEREREGGDVAILSHPIVHSTRPNLINIIFIFQGRRHSVYKLRDSLSWWWQSHSP